MFEQLATMNESLQNDLKTGMILANLAGSKQTVKLN